MHIVYTHVEWEPKREKTMSKINDNTSNIMFDRPMPKKKLCLQAIGSLFIDYYL